MLLTAMTDEEGEQENKHEQDRIFKDSLRDTYNVNDSGLCLSLHRLTHVYIACCRFSISLHAHRADMVQARRILMIVFTFCVFNYVIYIYHSIYKSIFV